MNHPRKIKLILPRLQIRMMVAFVCLSALALLLQYLLLISVLTRVASELPHDGLLLLDYLGPMLGQIFAISAGLLLPLTVCVGILATHRLAGPIYRFRIFLRQVIDGQRPADCKLRKGDELQDFCELLNQATAPLREQPKKVEHEPEVESNLRAAG
jgi:hypothetical protein